MNFVISAPLKHKSSGYGDKISNSPNIEKIVFRPKRADYNDFAYLEITLGGIEVCIEKEEVKLLIKALTGIL